MNTIQRFGALALAMATLPAQAALWSVDNAVVPAGNKTTLTLSVTGDGVAHGSNVDLVIPHGFKVTRTRALNGGNCGLLPNPNPTITADVVRAIQVDPWGALPARKTTVCEVGIAATTARSDWFRLTFDSCYDGTAQRVPCVLDPGYVIVLP